MAHLTDPPPRLTELRSRPAARDRRGGRARAWRRIRRSDPRRPSELMLGRAAALGAVPAAPAGHAGPRARRGWPRRHDAPARQPRPPRPWSGATRMAGGGGVAGGRDPPPPQRRPRRRRRRAARAARRVAAGVSAALRSRRAVVAAALGFLLAGGSGSPPRNGSPTRLPRATWNCPSRPPGGICRAPRRFPGWRSRSRSRWHGPGDAPPPARCWRARSSANGPSLLPASLRRRSSRKLPRADAVQPRRRLQAYRYEGVPSAGRQRDADGVCGPDHGGGGDDRLHGPAPAGAGRATTCEQIAATLELNGASAYRSRPERAVRVGADAHVRSLQSAAARAARACVRRRARPRRRRRRRRSPPPTARRRARWHACR